MESKSSTDEVALLLHQISLPAARRDYQLRSSSPAPVKQLSTSSSQLVSRAFQNARALSFNAAAHKDTVVKVPFVLHPAPNQRVFFSGPLTSSHAYSSTAMPQCPDVRAPAPRRHERSIVDSDVVSSSTAAHASHGELSDQPAQDVRDQPAAKDTSIDRALSTDHELQLHGSRSTSTARPWKNSAMAVIDRGPVRRAFSGDLRASHRSNPARSGELITRVAQARSCSDMAPKQLESEKKRGESKRRPTASIAWDTLNESQANSPQHELAAIPFQWEEAPGKPLATSRARNSTARLATPESREELERAQSHRFYARAAPLVSERPRNSSFDAAARISEVGSSEAHIDLVAPAAAKFLVEDEGLVRPARTTLLVEQPGSSEANVAVPFQWEEAPGVPKLDELEGTTENSKSKPVQLQLPPRLVSPAPPATPDAVILSKEEMRGRLRTRSMSGPLAGYHPHASPARRRQLQHHDSPAGVTSQYRRSCSPSKRSISPSSIPKWWPLDVRTTLFGIHGDGDRDPHSTITASLEAELQRDVTGTTPTSYGAGLGRTASSGAFLSEFRRSPRRSHKSASSKRSVSPSWRIHALAKQLTCKIIRTPSAKTQESPTGSPTSLLQDELHLSGPSSSNSDMDASSQTPVSEQAFSKSFSRVSYESFEHSFAHSRATSPAPPPRSSNSPPESPYLGTQATDFKPKGSLGAAELDRVKAMVKMCRSGSSHRKSSSTKSAEMWAPTLASYFRCLEAATMTNPAARGAPAAIATVREARSLEVANEALQTRLPYTMPSSTTHVVTVEQNNNNNVLWKEYCESPNHVEFRGSCLGGVKLPVAKFVGRAGGRHHNIYEKSNSSRAWSALPNASHVEDGYRSPAYAATLELLSPSAELFRKSKKRAVVMGLSSRRVKLVLPSTRRKTQMMEVVCTSLKRALYKCAKRCCRKASSPPPLNAASAR